MAVFTKFVWARFLCRHCDNDYNIKFEIPITPALNSEQLLDYIVEKNNSVQIGLCNKCGTKNLQLSSIECLPERDPYTMDDCGDSSMGKWVCKDNTHIEPVYPALLRIYMMGEMLCSITYQQKYYDIAQGGVPWKCPVCKKSLYYTESIRR
jgi:hypothetical protein